MEIEKINSKKLGKYGKEELGTYRLKRKKKGEQLTLNDIHNIKAQIKTNVEAKYDNFELKTIVFRNGGMWKTATDENKLLDYFTDLVKDPNKFLHFDSVDFHIIYS